MKKLSLKLNIRTKDNAPFSSFLESILQKEKQRVLNDEALHDEVDLMVGSYHIRRDLLAKEAAHTVLTELSQHLNQLQPLIYASKIENLKRESNGLQESAGVLVHQREKLEAELAGLSKGTWGASPNFFNFETSISHLSLGEWEDESTYFRALHLPHFSRPEELTFAYRKVTPSEALISVDLYLKDRGSHYSGLRGHSLAESLEAFLKDVLPLVTQQIEIPVRDGNRDSLRKPQSASVAGRPSVHTAQYKSPIFA